MKTINNDKVKNEIARTNNFNLIRIWQSELSNKLNEILEIINQNSAKA